MGFFGKDSTLLCHRCIMNAPVDEIKFRVDANKLINYKSRIMKDIQEVKARGDFKKSKSMRFLV